MNHNRIVTDLHSGLLTERKETTHDELYDTKTDPDMVHNLEESPEYEDLAEKLKVTINELFDYQHGSVDSKSEYTPEEIKVLKSLGYLQ